MQAIDSLELTEEKINALTDQIPQRPMGVVEGTSYSLVILFAFGVSQAEGRQGLGRWGVGEGGRRVSQAGLGICFLPYV